MRTARVKRRTAETNIVAEVNLDGEGVYDVATGIRFLDHMLATLSKHSLIDINLRAEGDLRHHVIEDVGIVLGRALSEALGERRGIRRFGYAITPMDEALALAAIDLVKRPKPVIKLRTKLDAIEDIPVSELVHFLESLAMSLEAAVHVRVLAGEDDHHKVEAVFKALALALRQAIEQDPRRSGVPSTKESM